MRKTKRNEKCPCGSGEKYKKCYLKELSSCTLFQKEKENKLEKEHGMKDKQVFRFFKEITEDIGSVFVKDKEKRELVAWRVQLIAIFTYIDILASYWFAYLDQNGTQKERFIDWVNKYCFINKNEVYDKSIYQNIDTEHFYDLRSSMVHFFGLSDIKKNTRFAIASNDISKDEFEKFEKGLKKEGISTYMIQTRKLHNLVTEGGILMMNEWRDIINKSQTDEKEKWRHIKGIDRIYKKIMQEGAIKIPKN